jgi:hypothetical protein
MDTRIPPYKLNSAAVKAIANARCSIHAAGTASRVQLQRLQQGDYQHALALGGTSRSCPSECFWMNNKCVAKWEARAHRTCAQKPKDTLPSRRHPRPLLFDRLPSPPRS